MFRRRPLLLFCLCGGLALLLGVQGPLVAQEEEKPTDPTFPPGMMDNLTKHVIRQDDGQSHGLILYTPASWTQQDPKDENDDWLAEFTINAAGQEPVKLHVLCYKNESANIGGGVQANIQRWINEFQEQGRDKKITTGQRSVTYENAKDHAAMEERKYVLVDLKGTRKSEDGPAANSHMLAAIIGVQWKENQDTEARSAVYFLKMAGPAKTVDGKVEDAFRQAFGALHKANENELKDAAAETTAN